MDGCIDHVIEQVYPVLQLRQRRHAQNIKAAVKHCADETTPLSQMYSPLQAHGNELQGWRGGVDASAGAV